MTNLQIETPRWAVPLLRPSRYKGAKGGRASGKSHFFAEMLVEDHIRDKDLQSVCIREIQKSLKFSAKKLVETKIRELGMQHLFDITQTEIRRIGGEGIIIFQGMQDHTADSIKSLEGFHRAWVEEAQSLSHRSMELLIPTIRQNNSELWFSWNPDQPTDAVEKLFSDGEDAILVHVNYTDNPWCPDEMKKLAARQMRVDYERYDHIWLGGFNTKSEAQVFAGKWRVDEFDPHERLWSGPYYGLDFGFANDPLAAVKLWINNDKLYVEYDAGKVGLELDDTPAYLIERIPGIKSHTVRADNARPESISYLRRKGIGRIEAVEKGKGSVEDGIEFIKSFDEVIIHPRCIETATEFRLYSYKIDKRSGDILPVVEDLNNHYIDAIRYALEPIMKSQRIDYRKLL